MSLNPKTSVASRNLALNAALDVLNSGFLDIYDGAQPTDADTAVGAQTKLARCNLASTAFGAAASGSKTAGAIANGTGLVASTATWYRLCKSDGTAVMDGSVGTATSNLVLNTTSIVVSGTVSVTSLVISQAA